MPPCEAPPPSGVLSRDRPPPTNRKGPPRRRRRSRPPRPRERSRACAWHLPSVFRAVDLAAALTLDDAAQPFHAHHFALVALGHQRELAVHAEVPVAQDGVAFEPHEL